ncbi:hypothetical protein ABW19_dt0206210 [Dactylella cylindrospora]|nr:hypothetical protein ABW19_dt0206210 [Dactylella cylindrospora]
MDWWKQRNTFHSECLRLQKLLDRRDSEIAELQKNNNRCKKALKSIVEKAVIAAMGEEQESAPEGRLTPRYMFEKDEESKYGLEVKHNYGASDCEEPISEPQGTEIRKKAELDAKRRTCSSDRTAKETLNPSQNTDEATLFEMEISDLEDGTEEMAAGRKNEIAGNTQEQERQTGEEKTCDNLVGTRISKTGKKRKRERSATNTYSNLIIDTTSEQRIKYHSVDPPRPQRRKKEYRRLYKKGQGDGEGPSRKKSKRREVMED